MNIEVKKEEKNVLLGRRDIIARAHSEGATPSRAQLKKDLATKFKAKEEHVIVTKVLPENGSSGFELHVRIYDDDKAMKEIEHQFQLKRHGLVEAKDQPAQG